MSAEPDNEPDEESIETERQATSMQKQLSKEVASWSQDRRHQPGETGTVSSQPVAQRRPRGLTGEAKKASASPVAAKPVEKRSKPFGMSYGGMTQAEYGQYLRDRGLR